MRNDKSAALKMRLGGKSYTQISRSLGIPKSTLSGWLSRVQLSEEVRTRIDRRGRKNAIAVLVERNKRQTSVAIARARNARLGAVAELGVLSPDMLRVVGAALYWAEGYKRPIVRSGRTLTNHPVSLTNSDPALIALFLRFLRECCKVPHERIRANLRIYEHQHAPSLLRFWVKETGIPSENFGRHYYGISKSSEHKRPFNRLLYGVIQIVVADTPLYHRIMGYIEALKEFV